MAGLSDSAELQNPLNAFDVNGNGQVEIGDALAIANRYAAGNSAYILQNFYYDVDGNDLFDIRDWSDVVVGVNQML